MKIIEEYPPNIEEIRKAFDLGDEKIVFTYGNIIYNPTKSYVSPDLIVHEKVHEKQQTRLFMSPKRWWKKYLKDSEFRLSQEVEAYQAQFRYVFDNHTGHLKAVSDFLVKISRLLADPMYGSLVTVDEAIKLIKNEN